jgi:hypothetical protein
VGECVYCGEHKPLTDDHIPPKNLFAKPRPNDLITVPCCLDCNSGFQKDDEYFRTVLVLWQETGTHPEARRLAKPVIRDLKRSKKFRFRRSILEKARPVSLFTKSGLYAGETGLFEVDRLRLHQTVIRMVKGLFYYHRRYRLADSYGVQVRVSAADSQTVNLIKSTLPQSVTPKVIANGAFKYWSELSSEDRMASVWILLFFEYLPFMCATVPKGFIEDPKELFGI